MNKHPVLEEELMAYLDGETSAGRAAEIAAHLENCGLCHQSAVQLSGLERRLREWEVETPSFGLSSEIHSALIVRGEDKRRTSRWQGWFERNRPLVVLGTFGVLLFVAILTWPLVERRAYPPQMAMRSQPEHPESAASRNEQADVLSTAPSERSMLTNSRALRQTLAPDRPLIRLEKGGTEQPLIVRRAELTLTTNAFDNVRPQLDRALAQEGGQIGQLNQTAVSNAPRTLTATLRIPANRLDAALAEFRKLGHVENETQSGDDVTLQHVDQQARLTNARKTEARLIEILETRTGKLSDVLGVEEELSRVRGQIETLQAEQSTLDTQISFGTVSLTVREEYHERLTHKQLGLWEQMENAAREGVLSLAYLLFSVGLWLLSSGPTLIVVALILFFPARYWWRRRRTTN